MVAYTNAAQEQTNTYIAGLQAKVADDSIEVGVGTLLKLTGGDYVQIAGAGDTIEGVSVDIETFAADNTTVAMKKVLYKPTTPTDMFTMVIAGTSIVFAGDLVTGNTIDLKVNGVAMTQVPFNTDNDTTLDDLATAIAAGFASVISAAARSGTRTIVIDTVNGADSVVITDIVVAGGASQTTGVVTGLLTAADVGKFYDINAAQYVDVTSESTSTGQLRLEKFFNGSASVFSIKNA